MEKKLPTIDIHGKEYTLVSTRILHFNENYVNGKIETEMLQNNDEVVVRAKVTPDIDKFERYFVAHSQAIKGGSGVNKTSALENCETSAVGRALGFMGIGVIESVASADEIVKSEIQPNYQSKTTQSTTSSFGTQFCPVCKVDAVISKKTNKPYCPNWKNHPKDQFIKLIPKPTENEIDFGASLEQDELDRINAGL